MLLGMTNRAEAIQGVARGCSCGPRKFDDRLARDLRQEAGEQEDVQRPLLRAAEALDAATVRRKGWQPLHVVVGRLVRRIER